MSNLDAARAQVYGTVDNQTYLSSLRLKNESSTAPSVSPIYRLRRRYVEPIHGGVNPAADNDIALFDPSQSISMNFEQENGTTEWRQNLNQRKRKPGRITTIGDHLINNETQIKPALIDERMRMTTKESDFLYPSEQKQFNLDVSRSRRFKEKQERQDEAWRAAHHKGNKGNRLGDLGYKYTLNIPNIEIAETLKDPRFKNPMRLIENDITDKQQSQENNFKNPNINKEFSSKNNLNLSKDQINENLEQVKQMKDLKMSFNDQIEIENRTGNNQNNITQEYQWLNLDKPQSHKIFNTSQIEYFKPEKENILTKTINFINKIFKTKDNPKPEQKEEYESLNAFSHLLKQNKREVKNRDFTFIKNGTMTNYNNQNGSVYISPRIQFELKENNRKLYAITEKLQTFNENLKVNEIGVIEIPSYIIKQVPNNQKYQTNLNQLIDIENYILTHPQNIVNIEKNKFEKVFGRLSIEKIDKNQTIVVNDNESIIINNEQLPSLQMNLKNVEQFRSYNSQINQSPVIIQNLIYTIIIQNAKLPKHINVQKTFNEIFDLIPIEIKKRILINQDYRKQFIQDYINVIQFNQPTELMEPVERQKKMEMIKDINNELDLILKSKNPIYSINPVDDKTKKQKGEYNVNNSLDLIRKDKKVIQDKEEPQQINIKNLNPALVVNTFTKKDIDQQVRQHDLNINV